MDALVHPHKHAPSFALHIPIRHFESISSSVVEPDPVLEDTPDTPDETVDYTVYPPEVGQVVIINENGNEVPLCDTPIKNGKRVICSFPYQNPQNASDPDEYPFHAITYGECESCFGLPYNDHNYASKDQKCKGSRLFETDDRLSILAKVALAKDQKTSDNCTDSDLDMNKQSVHPENGFSVTIVESPSMDPVTSNVSQHPTPKTSSVIYNSEIPVYPNMHSSLVTTARVATPANRTILLSTSRGVQNPPLQIHRVSSSLTPHVVLRTGLPGLQISTSAPRTLPSDATVRCVCDNNTNDGYLIQCEKCRCWQHSSCVSMANKGRIPSPYSCYYCQSRPLQCTKAITVQRQKITTFNPVTPTPTSNPAIRISRATTLNTGNSSRIYVTTSLCNASTRQVHVCLPTASTLSGNQRSEVSFLTTGSTTSVEETCYPNGTSRSTSFASYGQPMRSSKRKQDLLTLTSSSSANAGLEGFSASPPGTEGFGDLSDTNTSFSVDVNAHFTENALHTSSSTVPSHAPSVTSENRDSGVRNFPGSLHRLLLDYPNNSTNYNNNNNNVTLLHDPPNTDGNNRRASPSSTISSNSVISSSHVAYEEATDLRLSDRLYHKLDILFPAFHGLSTNYNDSCAYLKDLPTDLDSLQRCEVVNFDFNRKGLVATEDIYPREPIIEYRGLCMLLTEYNELYDYRKHYNPFVLFYKAWTKLALCVDARKYGNDARFIRRSCTPNCEVKHTVSFSDDPITGPTPRIRLIVVATRSICRSSELTLPFDFDYTACRYLVRCACIRKACPVSRWFQRSSQLTGTIQTPSRSSLICSRKLPNASRGYGMNGRPRAFSPLKNVDEERLSDDQDEELLGWYSKTTGANIGRLSTVRGSGRHGLSSLVSGRLWSSTHSQLHSRISMRDPSTLASATGKPGRRRGRGRGRIRASVMLDRRNSTRSLVKLSNRGRPAGSGKTLTAKKHRALGHSLRSRNVTKAPVSETSPIYSPKRRDDNDIRRREARVSKDSSSDLQTHNLSLSSPHSKSEVDFSGSVVDRADSSTLGNPSPNDRHETHIYSDDELDADTEPECDGTMGDMLEHHLTPKKSIHSKSRTKSEEFNNSITASYNWDQSNESDANKDDNSVRFTDSDTKIIDTESRRPSAPNYPSSKSLRHAERGKRRHNSVASNEHSSSLYKKTKSREEKHEKSREEVWMAEVLRRIERMEKKRLKQRPTVEQNLEVKVETSLDENKEHSFHSPTPTLTPTDVLLDGSPEDQNEQDVYPDKTSETETALVLSSSTQVTKVESLPSNENVYVKYASPTLDVKSPIVSSDSYNELRQSNESNLRSPSLDQTVEHEDENIKHPSSPLITISKPKSSRSSRNNRSRNSPARQRRRRSQAALLSDGLSSNSAEQGGSREDRWLQQQLRRIAELEDQDDTSPWDIGNCPIKRDSPESKDQNSIKKDDLMLDSNDDTADSDQKYASQAYSKYRRRRVSSGTQMQSDERSIHKDFSDEQKLDAEIDSPNCQKSNQKVSDIADSDTDCGLIVYRAREKDPMAKFSRSRSSTEAYTSYTSMDAFGSVNSMIESDIVNKSENTTSGHLIRLASHATPKPTKKRWLSQALLEEDGDACTFTNGNHVSSGPNESIPDKKPDLELASSITLSHGPSICAVNPKKRIISKFSELKEDDVTKFVSDRDSALSATSANVPIENNASSTIENESTKETSIVISGVKDGSEVTLCAAPLPPKKATVKQQAEELRLQEMRKVRVSLSEYRRRRGLPTNPPPPAADSTTKEPTPRTNPVTVPLDIDDLEINIPPALMSPSKVLNVVPTIPDSLQSSRVENVTTTLIADPNAKTSGFQHLYRSVPSDPRLANQKVDDFVEIHTNERGPRTPSEPPEDDEDDGLEDMNSPNHISKAALSSSSEPSVNFGYKAYSRSVNSPKYSPPQSDPRTSGYGDDRIHRDASVSIAVSKSQISTQSNRIKNSVQDPTDHLESSDLKRNSNSTFDADCPMPRDSASPSLHSYSSLKTQPNLPPPPPPLFVNFSSHPKSDVPVHHQSPVGSHRLEADGEPNEKNLNCVPGSLEYFIKRDQEIRMWQETRSYERERRHSSPWLPRPPHTSRVRHARKPSFNTSRHSSKEPHDTENFFPNQVSVTGHFDNVEQTLWRIRDTLQAQLDLTRMASATHGTNSSTNSNGTLR